MRLKRERVVGILILCMGLSGGVSLHAQGNGRTNRSVASSTLETYEGSSVRALITMLQAKVAQLDQALLEVGELEARLDAEVRARLAADLDIHNKIAGLGGGGVSQATLDAAIEAEAAARAAADTALQGNIDNEAASRTSAIAALQADVDTLSPLTSLAPLATHVSVETGTINDLPGPHVIFTGANVHIRNGHSWADSLTENGKGNLILGYNESGGYAPAERNGSHNVVVGPYHRYNFGVGLVIGYNSRLGGDGASVSGGLSNNAGGEFASVSGGSNNHATALAASVSGGDNNVASGGNASISAGQMNQASGDLSSVSGGTNNSATAVLSTIGGGANQTNSVGFTFVP